MPEGPWLPNNAEFNRIYAEFLKNYPHEVARIERIAEENTARLNAEEDETNE